MEYFWLTISIFFGLGCTVTKKYFTNKVGSSYAYVFLFNAVSGIVATAFFLILNGFSGFSAYSVWMGLLFGLITVVQSVFFMLAFQTGPMSFTVVMVNFSTVITAILGAFLWEEDIKLLQVVGVALSVVSFVLAVEKKGDEKRATWIWLLYCVIAMLTTSGIGLMQKIHQTSAYKHELDGFLLVAFAFLSLVSIAGAFLFKKKDKVVFFEKKEDSNPWLLLAVMLITGLFVAVPNKLNAYLAGVIDAVVFFPLVNGGNLILSTLSALIIFKEKLTKKQWFGVAFGIASFACLCF